MTPAAAQALADALLLAHAALALFVLLLPVAVLLGWRRGWRVARSRRLRWLHAAAIGVVAAEAWLGLECPLTTWENALRLQAGGSPYAQSFIGHWVQRALFYSAPPWVFTAAYTGFGLFVAWLAWRRPPR